MTQALKSLLGTQNIIEEYKTPLAANTHLVTLVTQFDLRTLDRILSNYVAPVEYTTYSEVTDYVVCNACIRFEERTN